MPNLLIVGSAPCAARLAKADLRGFETVALNHAWQLRPDFHIHACLKAGRGAVVPAPGYPARHLGHAALKRSLEAHGGLILCSRSVSLAAGYWALDHRRPDTIRFYGCDLIYEPEADGRTHFYGRGDPGPLRADHPGTRRQDLRAVRLFATGLFRGVLIGNASWRPGSQMPLPEIPLDADAAALARALSDGRPARRVRELAADAFAAEARLRCPAFDGPWRRFPEDHAAVARLEAILRRWQLVQEAVFDLCRQAADRLAPARVVA